MQKITTGQAVFVILMAILLMFVLPMLQSKTGKSFVQLLFGAKKGSGKPAASVREPHAKNSSRDDLTVFLSKLIRSAKKSEMQVVAPASFSYKGKKTKLFAFLVHKGGVIGICCFGYGGILSASASPDKPWEQSLNGKKIRIQNPLGVCREQQLLVSEAMKAAGINAELDVLPVFTNPNINIEHRPQGIYSTTAFFDYIEHTSAFRSGGLDVQKTAKALADLVDIRKKRGES